MTLKSKQTNNKKIVMEDKWISVKDRLPDYGVPVFLARDESTYVGIRVATDASGETYHFFEHPKDILSDSKMTHWQPIVFPEIPNK